MLSRSFRANLAGLWTRLALRLLPCGAGRFRKRSLLLTNPRLGSKPCASQGEPQLVYHEAEIDVRGLLCPLPVLKARKRLAAMKPGECLRVLASDPAAAIDFPHWCNESGNELVRQSSDGDVLEFVIRKTHGG
jgi:tRNA 2-thiouridine synthesizing protein A